MLVCVLSMTLFRVIETIFKSCFGRKRIQSLSDAALSVGRPGSSHQEIPITAVIISVPSLVPTLPKATLPQHSPSDVNFQHKPFTYRSKM